MNGHHNYHAGLCAEDIVARHYAAMNQPVAKRRWRGQAGEVDLIARNGAQVVFVEVKKSKTLTNAAMRLGPRQIDRLLAAGAEFIGSEPNGLLTDVRFDVAMVDGQGRVEIIENALCA